MPVGGGHPPGNVGDAAAGRQAMCIYRWGAAKPLAIFDTATLCVHSKFSRLICRLKTPNLAKAFVPGVHGSRHGSGGHGVLH